MANKVFNTHCWLWPEAVFPSILLNGELVPPFFIFWTLITPGMPFLMVTLLTSTQRDLLDNAHYCEGKYVSFQNLSLLNFSIFFLCS